MQGASAGRAMRNLAPNSAHERIDNVAVVDWSAT
jgi:hypothetical protein